MNSQHRVMQQLEARIRTLLPPLYQESYKDVLPVSMGSARLKLDEDGIVRWDDIWVSFCDLAMAGGPPHRGTLLEPDRIGKDDFQSDQYSSVLAEISRGIGLVTGLKAFAAADKGWIRVACENETMARWLVRAIVMENVSAYSAGAILCLPVGSAFRIEKEIKNVISSLAKTFHYWTEHIPKQQQSFIADLLVEMTAEGELLEPDNSENGSLEQRLTFGGSVTQLLEQTTGLRSFVRRCGRWMGVGIEDVSTAISMMRLLSVRNILARREATVLFVPVNEQSDPGGKRTVASIKEAHQLVQE